MTEYLRHLLEEYRKNNPTAAGSPELNPAFEYEAPWFGGENRPAAGSQEPSPAAGPQGEEPPPAAGAPYEGPGVPARTLGRPRAPVVPMGGGARNDMAADIAQEQGRSDLNRLASREQELDSERSEQKLQETMGQLSEWRHMFGTPEYPPEPE